MNGLLVFDKPKGITSHDVVYKVRKKTGIKKVGHTGTLDPLATGVLVICIGRATKVSDYVLSSDKEYIAKIKLGLLTDSYDINGNILKEEDVSFNRDEIEIVLNSFIGEQMQTPPIYSAIKINGQKLYEYARSGKEINIPKRKISINSIELLDFNDKDEITIKVSVSKGTYIRSLANDIGKKLNTNGTITELRRTKTGDFNITEAIDMDKFSEMSLEEIDKHLLPIDKALDNLKNIKINANFRDRILNGVFYKLDDEYSESEYKIYCGDEFLGIGEIRKIDGEYFLKMKKRLIGE
ncbi:tRNA pseudouridine(55) synthase TruB [Peptoniphilus sp.]|jgi:tRNA pseudouridine55 synthase|uniref:tRNA pseudouridine(55) synthase TruB n=1 Tax=Peptoniphilus sp. TaxID=1971214 RepID=UPI003D931FE2